MKYLVVITGVLVAALAFLPARPTLSVFAQAENAPAEVPQEQSVASTSALPIDSYIIETQASQDQVKELRSYYNKVVVLYRNQEREALLAQSQYEQLTTLSALEEAVAKTKLAVISRDEVLATYVSILFFELRDTVGVNLQSKSEVLDALEILFEQLKNHKAQAESASSRDDLAVLHGAFQVIGPTTQETTQQAVTLITLGRLQTVSDKGKSLTEEIDTTLATLELEPAELAKKQRALTVTKQLNDDIAAEFRQIYDRIQDGQSTSQWLGVQDKTNVLYANLSQLVSYLLELATQVPN